MPDQLNKQSLINLLIDSPLREPIKINLIDIVNNTSDPDLPKVFPTITKELEIFQKATERRMKLADETITKLGGSAPAAPAMPASPSTSTAPAPALPPVDLPPLPTPPVAPTTPSTPPPSSLPPLAVPPLDLPPLPASPSLGGPTPAPVTTPENPAPTSTTTPAMSGTAGSLTVATGDEAALAEIQKELDSLKSAVSTDAAPAVAPAPQS